MSFIKKFIFKSSIKRQLMLSIASVHAVMMTLFIIDLVNKQEDFLQKQTQNSLKSSTYTLSINSKQALLSNDVVALEELIGSFVNYPHLRYAMITDLNGKIQAHTDKTKVGYYPTDKISMKFLKSKKALFIDHDFSMDYTIPIKVEDKKIGTARISLSKDSFLQSRKNIYLEGFLYTLLAIIVGLIIAFYMSKSMTNSLYNLIDIIEQTIKGKRNIRVSINRDDEIGQLTNEFNSMLSALEDNEQKLNKSKNQLKELNVNLEQLVDKKTKELSLLNNELENRIKKALDTNKLQIQQMILQSRQAQMGEMISMIAHQWRQPLSAISSTIIDMKIQSQLKRYDLNKKEEALKYEIYVNNNIDVVQELIQILSKTIDDFRNFFKPNKQTVILNINEPIQQALKIIKSSFLSVGITINEIYNSKKKISMYDSELMQVFLNIFKNSYDNFIEKHTEIPTLVIKTYDIDNDVIVEIIDNGGGIKKDILDKIFEPYFSTKEKHGTGLGLYMSKTIVEEHHTGKLNVQNTDNGLCFIIKISESKEVYLGNKFS